MARLLDDNDFAKSCIAVLVARFQGEEIKITQADLDNIAYTRLLEGWQGKDFLLKVERRTKQ